MATIGTRLSPLAGTDTFVKNGCVTTINTRLQVMSAMKEFKHYSLEELRDWDYETDKVTKGNIRGAQGFFESMKNTQVNDDAKLFSAGVILTPSNGPRESDAVGTPRSYEMVPTGDTGLVLYPKTCMQCVVDMAAFRLLSIEELRFNDYRLLQLTSRFNPGTRKKIFTYPKGSEEEVVLGETLIFSTQLVCITAISEYMDFSLEMDHSNPQICRNCGTVLKRKSSLRQHDMSDRGTGKGSTCCDKVYFSKANLNRCHVHGEENAFV
ncbi:uncharacterized protein LOC127850132 isoform X3 [Dreissena polymorpha]|uniref:uncharacterized protein LOC127850132 isoform X3 n=1 Tax=Dreissena polymorpha TaxID=45954 RepID=UPI0022645181|nr:uncharacterized protein LOC127850132 isoform X3 [Dreissena polymorpha]